MAVNSWIVPFHSSVVKVGCIGELQKATFTGQSLIIFTAYCWTADSHLTNHQFCPFMFLTRSQLKEENMTPVAFLSKKHFFYFLKHYFRTDVFPPCGCDRGVYVYTGVILTFPQSVRTCLPFTGPTFEAANTQGTKLWRRPRSGVCTRRRERQKASTCFICVCVGEGRAERHVILGERPLALALRWPLTQIKLPQFAPSPLVFSPPSASLLCPLPGTFVFTWPTSQGTRSYLWLSGLAAECAAPVKFFHSDLPQHPNWTVQSFPVIPPQPRPYPIFANNVKFHRWARQSETSGPFPVQRSRSHWIRGGRLILFRIIIDFDYCYIVTWHKCCLLCIRDRITVKWCHFINLPVYSYYCWVFINNLIVLIFC